MDSVCANCRSSNDGFSCRYCINRKYNPKYKGDAVIDKEDLSNKAGSIERF